MRAIVLDSGPLGLLTYSRANAESTGCNQGLYELASNGHAVILPEIVDYELRRELLRLEQVKGLLRLESLRTVPGVDYDQLTTQVMRMAAEFWATARKRGRPTADPKELDCDVILAAQASILARSGFDVVVATANNRHLAQFVQCSQWYNIPTQ